VKENVHKISALSQKFVLMMSVYFLINYRHIEVVYFPPIVMGYLLMDLY
jgi:F0F1-type ATP synthase assembly protein I